MDVERLYSFQELWRQYRTCRRNKRNTFNALAFELNAEAKLLELRRDLISHSYRPGRSICFVTDGPKPREVFAADFRDRIVHHLLVHHLEKLFEPRFIHDSYACRPGKGTLAASDRLMTMLRQITANGARPAWFLKLDVASFFPSIDKSILNGILRRHAGDDELRWLIHVILFHDPTRNYVFRSVMRRVPPPASPDYPVAARKSLFGKNNERGLPIGNLTSQFWGNVYLNELDHFVKRRLRCRHYVRYVDDMIFLASEPETLLAWKRDIVAFLADRLRLELRADAAAPRPVRGGIDFVGWKTWHRYRAPRRQTLATLRGRIAEHQRSAVRLKGAGRLRQVLLSPPASTTAPRSYRQRLEGRRLCASLASYAGHLHHGKSLTAWANILRVNDWLGSFLLMLNWRVQERWGKAATARGACRFERSYWHLTRRAGREYLLFWPTGCFIEFYGPQRLLAQSILRLEPVPLRRGDFGLTVGFPQRLRGVYRARALRAGIGVVELETADGVP